MTYSNACYPHINKPTRIVNNSATLIDNIFSNVFDKDVDSGLLYSDISDHLPIFVITHNNISMKGHTISTTYRKETPQNMESFKADLANEEWTDVLNQSNTNIAYDRFNTKLQKYYDKNFPLVTSEENTKSKKMPWITKTILRSIYAREINYIDYI